jgi:hypothetical protein
MMLQACLLKQYLDVACRTAHCLSRGLTKMLNDMINLTVSMYYKVIFNYQKQSTK